VSKQVSTKVYFIVFGSSIASCRWLCFNGNSFAEGLFAEGGVVEAAHRGGQPHPPLPVDHHVLVVDPRVPDLLADGITGFPVAACQSPSDNGIPGPAEGWREPSGPSIRRSSQIVEIDIEGGGDLL
jgi:hypothetical protein